MHSHHVLHRSSMLTLHILQPLTPPHGDLVVKCCTISPTDLNNPSLHTSYAESDDIMIEDGSSFYIIHTNSTTFPTVTCIFNLYVTCILIRRLESISQPIFTQPFHNTLSKTPCPIYEAPLPLNQTSVD